jgi:predicted permease
MGPVKRFFARVKNFVGGRRNDGGLDERMNEEIDEHIALQAAENLRAGMAPEEARRQAALKFGGAAGIKEEYRDERGLPFIDNLMQDLRYGMRMLRKSPGFTTIAVLTLALGIGANTAIFSFVYGVLLAPLPYRDASSLVVVNETTPRVGIVSASYPNFLDWRAQSHAFSEMAYYQQINFNLAGANVSRPENIQGDAVPSNFLSMMGIRPYLGRDFLPAEDKAGTQRVLLLGYQLWQSHFGADPNVVGRSIALDGNDFVIVGVLPANYRSLDKVDVMLPIGVWLTNNQDAMDRGDRGDSMVIGRLAAGATLEQARAEMEGIAANLAKEYPEQNDQFGVQLRTMRDAFAGEMRVQILVLFAAVVFVLLIASANVANLFLVRGAARTKEIALRMAFGASRGRIIRQLLTESFVLAIAGGAIGLAIAFAGIRLIALLIPQDALMGATIGLNGAVLLFTACVVVLAALVFGMAPAMQWAKRDVQEDLKEGGRTASVGSAHNRLRGILAVAEIALALVLLAGTGLMLKSLYKLINVNPGFQPDRVLTMEMYLSSERYAKQPAVENFWKQVLDGVRALPGVESAALGNHIPLTDAHGRTDITIEGMALPKPGSFPHPDVHAVTPAYIRTLGVVLERGRDFTEADIATAPEVALVNEKLARQYWPNEDPVGKRFLWGRFNPAANKPPSWVTVVGVVGDTKMYGLANPARFEVYIPVLQSAPNDMTLLVKSRIDPTALTSEIRGVVAGVDKDQPIFAIATMDKVVSNGVAGPRLTLVLLGLFSGLALILAAIGIYGVISYSVAQRTHEIGVRMTLGAQRGDILRMVLGQGGRIAFVGIAIGMVAAFALTRLMAGLLFSVRAGDPATFGVVATLLAVVALVACYVPARRALRVDPMIALRYE